MSTTVTAKPILKWAGGKSQLLEQISNRLPKELYSGEITCYAEPFIGGGAVFLYIAKNFPLKKYYISDFNQELILMYLTIQQGVDKLIRQLAGVQDQYYALSLEKQEEYFYTTRSAYNAKISMVKLDQFSKAWIERTAQIIFLNRTCFNGLFRVNSKGEFNVPFGDYKNPRICDADNLRAVAQILQSATIENADFTGCEKFVNKQTFVYFDPPYRPLSKTANFKSYSKKDFNDEEQIRLAHFFARLHAKGARLMLSNSDPTNVNPNDVFFEQLYKDFNIQKVTASRIINSNASKRGNIFELLITNYRAGFFDGIQRKASP